MLNVYGKSEFKYAEPTIRVAVLLSDIMFYVNIYYDEMDAWRRVSSAYIRAKTVNPLYPFAILHIYVFRVMFPYI